MSVMLQMSPGSHPLRDAPTTPRLFRCHRLLEGCSNSSTSLVGLFFFVLFAILELLGSSKGGWLVDTVLTKWGKGLQNYARVPTMQCFNLSISEINNDKIGPG